MLWTSFRDQNMSLKTYTLSANNSVSGYRENQKGFCHVGPQAGYDLRNPK